MKNNDENIIELAYNLYKNDAKLLDYVYKYNYFKNVYNKIYYDMYLNIKIQKYIELAKIKIRENKFKIILNE